jgi:hypothetical protein
MFSPRTILWGGVASVLGGLFWMIQELTTDTDIPIILALILGVGWPASIPGSRDKVDG